MKSKFGIILLWILVFLLGGVAGAISHYLYCEKLKPVVAPTKPSKQEDVIERMAQEFNLDAQQKESLKTIFAGSLERYKTLGKQYKPQWLAIRNETDEQIKQILRPDQREKYEEFLKKVYSKRPKPPGSKSQK